MGNCVSGLHKLFFITPPLSPPASSLSSGGAAASSAPDDDASPQPALPPDVPYDMPLPPHWRTHITDVPRAPSTGSCEKGYMQMNEYGSNVDSQVCYLKDIALYCQMEGAFPHYITLFLDGTWTTRLRQTTFKATDAAGGHHHPQTEVGGECVIDSLDRICRVTQVRFRHGKEQIRAIPLDGVADSNYNYSDSPNDNEAGTTLVIDEPYWRDVDTVKRCVMP